MQINAIQSYSPDDLYTVTWSPMDSTAAAVVTMACSLTAVAEEG